MSLFESVSFAIKKIKYLPSIQRNIEVYKNPDFENNSANIIQHDFVDFAISLSISGFLALATVQLFHNHYKFNPTDIIYTIPFTLLFIINTTILAIFLGLTSSIVYLILHQEYQAKLFGNVVRRIFRLYSIINLFIVLVTLKWTNDVFIFGSIHNNGFLIDLFLIVTLIGIPFAISLRILFLPLSRVFNIRSKFLSILVTLLIFIIPIKINSFISSFIPPTLSINEEVLIQKLNNSPYTKGNLLKYCGKSAYTDNL